MAEMIRKLVGAAPYFIPDDAARAIRRTNLEDAYRGIKPHPTNIDSADQTAINMTQEHIQDSKDSPLWPLMPMGIASDAIESTGTGRSARVANDIMWADLAQNGNYTNKLRNTLTGNAPTVRKRGLLGTEVAVDSRAPDQMGHSFDTAVTRTSPWRLLDGITGDRAQSDRVLTRIRDRNHPDGSDGMGDNSSVYHLGNLEDEWKRKWLMFRGLSPNSFANTDGKQGFASALHKQIYHNAFGDPYVNGRGTPGLNGFNVGQHEGIHSILDGVNPSQAFINEQRMRPAVTDRQWQLGPDSYYLGSNGTEMSNLLFHLKRQTETVNPKMRDIGLNKNTADNFIDYVRHYDATGADPMINLPGHRQIDQPAHGYESGMQKLQEIIDAAGKDGLNDIKDMNFKTGATNPSLRTKLLA
jgi:hypothetical protein